MKKLLLLVPVLVLVGCSHSDHDDEIMPMADEHMLDQEDYIAETFPEAEITDEVRTSGKQSPDPLVVEIGDDATIEVIQGDSL